MYHTIIYSITNLQTNCQQVVSDGGHNEESKRSSLSRIWISSLYQSNRKLFYMMSYHHWLHIWFHYRICKQDFHYIQHMSFLLLLWICWEQNSLWCAFEACHNFYSHTQVYLYSDISCCCFYYFEKNLCERNLCSYCTQYKE